VVSGQQSDAARTLLRRSDCRLLIPDPCGAIAQLGERLLCKQEVVGSIPSGSTNLAQPVVAQRTAAAVGGLDVKTATLAHCSLKRRRGAAAAESSFVEKFGFARARDLSPSVRVV